MAKALRNELWINWLCTLRGLERCLLRGSWHHCLLKYLHGLEEQSQGSGQAVQTAPLRGKLSGSVAG